VGKEIGTYSFFGEFVYEQIVPRDHFLMKLNQVVKWERLTKRLIRYYRGKGKVGRPPYDPVVLLKMLFISYLYDLSERQAEEAVSYNLVIKAFIGLRVDERAPDATTLSVFKRRLLDGGGLKALEGIFQEVLVMAQRQGIKLGKIQIIDSVHSIADVNTEKEVRRRKKGELPRDPNARWGVSLQDPVGKGTKRVTDEKGRSRKEKEYFYGYKQHVSLNAETGLITSLRFSPGSAYDGHFLPPLIESDLEQGVPVGIVAADRGYDDGENHEFLRQKGIASAIHLNRYRTQKKDKDKESWVEMKSSPQCQKAVKERRRIEAKLGEMKGSHGLRRCRYLGLLRYALQGYFTALVVNLKRILLLLMGVRFRPLAKATCGGV